MLVITVLPESHCMPSAFDVEKPSVVPKGCVCIHLPTDELSLEMVMHEMRVIPGFPVVLLGKLGYSLPYWLASRPPS